MAPKTDQKKIQSRIPEAPEDLDDIQNDGTDRSEVPEEVSLPNRQREDEVDIEVEQEAAMRSHFFHPSIICGYCEKCGTAKYVGGKVTRSIDKSSGQIKHRLSGGSWEVVTACQCPHYSGLYKKGQRIQCTYCKEEFTGLRTSSGQFKEILGTRLVYVMSFADQPNKLIMYCDAFECREKHIKRLKNNV